MELLVCSRFTSRLSRLYAEIPAKRAEDRKALDRLSHIRHTSTVFTLFYRDKNCCSDKDKTVVQYREKERQKGKKDFKGSAEKNL